MLDGGRLRLLRVQNGLTQKDISDATGVNIRTIKGYENHNNTATVTLSQENYVKWINAIYTTKHKEAKTTSRKKVETAAE